MKIPLKYIARNFKNRKLTTLITVSGITLVVFVFTAVLMMAEGVQQTLKSTGLDDNVLIARKASNGEVSSIIDGETVNVISSMPLIAKTEDGRPIVSPEPVGVINLYKSPDIMSNIALRGVSPEVFRLRPQIKIIDGRMINWGVREILAGASVAKSFQGAKIGDKVKFAGDFWPVVGIFDAGGSGFDSELWGDAKQLLAAYNRGSSVSTMTVKLEDKLKYEEFKSNFKSDKRLQYFEPKIESQYFEEQSEALAIFISALGSFVTIIFSLGATIGALITMYASVANRTTEIGTLRALGFRRSHVLWAFMIESMLMALMAGLAGIILASGLQFFSISTLNFQTFSQLEFKFSLSPGIVVTSIIFSLSMGFLGGFLPSIRASRLSIVDSLRNA